MTKILSFCTVSILTPISMYPFLQVQTLVELVLCKPRPILISLFVIPLTFCSLWGDALLSFSQHWKDGKLFFLIWANTDLFTFATTQLLLLQTQKTEIDINCVCTKQSWANNLVPKREFSLHLKQVWDSERPFGREIVADPCQTQPLSMADCTRQAESWWSGIAVWTAFWGTCSEGSWDHLKGSTEMPKLSLAALEIGIETVSWCFHDVGFDSSWN